ncbi:hypothetical protein [Nitrincola sp.]|uniref:hypothetical protein n=1 Tax=Nitrincola sp. TaxID=1926584 RepID=UPI003A952075
MNVNKYTSSSESKTPLGNDNNQQFAVIDHDGIQGYAETAYLMANPKNAERLLQAIARLKAGEYIDRQLVVK